MTKERRNDIQIYSAVLMLLFGAGLTIAGFIVSPVGEISDSVLWVLAQSLLYAGSALGITAYMQAKFNDIKRDVEKRTFVKEEPSNS